MNILVLLLLAVKAATPASPVVPILSQENVIRPDGSYRSSYVAGNGIVENQQGALKNIGDPIKEALGVMGNYSFPGDDGRTYKLTYTADEGGFQPMGDHLPTPPPIPDHVIRALEHNSLHPEEEQEEEENRPRYKPPPSGNTRPYRSHSRRFRNRV